MRDRDNRALARERIGKLLFSQSFPAIIGMLALSMYHIADMFFVARYVGTLGVAAVSVTAPLQIFTVAVSQMVGIGMASLLSRNLGAGNRALAERVLGNFMLLVILAGLSLTALGYAFLSPLLRLFGATPAILPHAREYMGIILTGTTFFVFAAAGNNMIRAEGKATFAMTAMLIAAGLNILLDPVFILYCGWGLKGAAAATVIGKAGAGLFVSYYFAAGKSSLKISRASLHLNREIIRESCQIGVSSFARQGSNSLMLLILNNLLGKYGSALAIAAYGIIHQVLLFVYMPILGIGQGLQPIVGFNYGAKSYKRVKKAVYAALKGATVMTSAAFLVLFLYAGRVISFFTTDPALVKMAAAALRTIVYMLPLAALQTLTSGIYQALGKALPAFFISLLRQVVLFIPFLLIFAPLFALPGIWFSFPAADGGAALICFLVLNREMKKLERTMEEGA